MPIAVIININQSKTGPITWTIKYAQSQNISHQKAFVVYNLVNSW